MHSVFGMSLELPLEKQKRLSSMYGFVQRPDRLDLASELSTIAPPLAKINPRNDLSNTNRIAKTKLIQAKPCPQIAARGRRTPRKIYKKERASRRLAGKTPEYGLLL
jgi:hypothetical protein